MKYEVCYVMKSLEEMKHEVCSTGTTPSHPRSTATSSQLHLGHTTKKSNDSSPDSSFGTSVTYLVQDNCIYLTSMYLNLQLTIDSKILPVSNWQLTDKYLSNSLDNWLNWLNWHNCSCKSHLAGQDLEFPHDLHPSKAWFITTCYTQQPQTHRSKNDSLCTLTSTVTGNMVCFNFWEWHSNQWQHLFLQGHAQDPGIL